MLKLLFHRLNDDIFIIKLYEINGKVYENENDKRKVVKVNNAPK